MKKVISIVAIIAGVLLVVGAVAPMVIGAILRMQIPASVGIIGGADGPTAVFVAGKLGMWSVISEILVGVLFIVAGVFLLRKNRKK